MKCLSIFNLNFNPCHSQSFAPRFGTRCSPSQDTAKALRAAATDGALSQRMWSDAVRSRKPPKGGANCSEFHVLRKHVYSCLLYLGKL